MGGLYGGGGGGSSSVVSATGGNGGQGVVRVIFGPGRAFPSTNTDLASSNGNVTVLFRRGLKCSVFPLLLVPR